MEIAADILQTQWPQLKDKVQLQWNKLTTEDVAQLNGKREQLLGLLWLRYRYGRVEADMEITRWLGKTR